MRTLIHLSDLHFGRTDSALLAPLIELAHRLVPDLVVVSGDLTQRARVTEFQQARAFLDALPVPQIVVPGNHDVPLHNLFARFVQPFKKYRRYISNNLQPAFDDEEIAVLGINTARSLTIKGGRISHAQMRWVQAKLCAVGNNVVKIVVTHHPFDVPDSHSGRLVVGRATRAMSMLAKCGADMFLAGHLHISHTGHTAERYKISGHSALVVQAGTAVSTRGREESNSFNVLSIDPPHVVVERYQWQPEQRQFGKTTPENFVRTAEGWQRLTD
jgi:3',5'-cyclic AMP phosphodiesterase CpdA